MVKEVFFGGKKSSSCQGSLVPNVGDNRYNCFNCDLDFCKMCVNEVLRAEDAQEESQIEIV